MREDSSIELHTHQHNLNKANYREQCRKHALEFSHMIDNMSDPSCYAVTVSRLLNGTATLLDFPVKAKRVDAIDYSVEARVRYAKL